MCTYNGEPYLAEQLASIATQTRQPDELVVCDDQSTDNSREIVAAFAATVPFPVDLHVNERNIGFTKNFERAITLCNGDIIALADHDDVWLPQKLKRLETCFRKPEVGLAFSDAEVVDKELRPLGYRLWESVGFDEKQRQLVRSGRVLDVLLPGWTVTGATMAFRAKFRNLIVEFPTDLPLIHDGWIALLIASVAEVEFVEEPLIKYRQHERQQIGAKERAPYTAPPGIDGAREAMRRSNAYDDLLAIGTQARQRLTEHQDQFNTTEAIAKLDPRLKHLQVRANLPAGKLRRASCVLRELLSHRYHHYSNGVYSAVKDLLA